MGSCIGKEKAKHTQQLMKPLVIDIDNENNYADCNTAPHASPYQTINYPQKFMQMGPVNSSDIYALQQQDDSKLRITLDAGVFASESQISQFEFELGIELVQSECD